jgi:hypothetical protein
MIVLFLLFSTIVVLVFSGVFIVAFSNYHMTKRKQIGDNPHTTTTTTTTTTTPPVKGGEYVEYEIVE